MAVHGHLWRQQRASLAALWKARGAGAKRGDLQAICWVIVIASHANANATCPPPTRPIAVHRRRAGAMRSYNSANQ